MPNVRNIGNTSNKARVTLTRSTSNNGAVKQFQDVVNSLKLVTYIALCLGIIAILASAAAIYLFYTSTPKVTNTTHFGSTLAKIDTPLNSTALAIINNAPNSYFQEAGTKYLNGSVSSIYLQTNKVNQFLVNNKTSVIYLGSITCIYCAENRWAMALALSRFGKFSNLYYGYSSLGDRDVPTLYWSSLNYNSSSDAIGNEYSSKYINFISIEDTNPITGSFNLNPPSKISSNLAALNNPNYINAFNYIQNLSKINATAFKGTPYTIWGSQQFPGADAVDFNGTTSTGQPGITFMTHAQILNQFANPQNQFAWTEYAAADVYVASICSSLSNSTKSSISACSLPAIKSIELQLK